MRAVPLGLGVLVYLRVNSKWLLLEFELVTHRKLVAGGESRFELRIKKQRSWEMVYKAF